MGLFGRDYDRDFGARGGMGDRGYRSGWGAQDRGDSYPRMNRYEPDMGMGQGRGMDGNRGMGMQGYDREFGPSGYDRSYKSRWQTDFGDPFGDRAARTPMRVMRGEYRGGYDRGFFGGGQGQGRYDRNFGGGRGYPESNPMGYDPYGSREGTWMRGNDRNQRTYGRGYDTGWY